MIHGSVLCIVYVERFSSFIYHLDSFLFSVHPMKYYFVSATFPVAIVSNEKHSFRLPIKENFSRAK